MEDVWTVKRLLDWSANYFKNKAIEPSKLNSQLLLAHVLNLPKLHLFLQFDRVLTVSELAKYKKLLLRRANHEPVEYIIESTDFIDVRLIVKKGVLIPRPETEILAIKAEQYIKKMTAVQAIIDIGTGSGALAIYLKKRFSDINVFATDVDETALEIASKNAEQNDVEIKFVNGFFPDQEQLSEKLHLVIISNPPYIRTADIPKLQPEVREHEPTIALDGGEDGLRIIKEIIVKCLELKCNSTIFMEIGYDQADDVKYLCDLLGVFEVIFFEDMNHVQRVAKIDIKIN